MKDLFNPLLRLGVKIDRILSGRKLEILGDYREKNPKDGKRPHIYAVSHVGRYDFESAVEAVRDHAYFFYGDKEEAYRNFDGFLIECNGAVTLETGYYTDREGEIRFNEQCLEDRHIAQERAIALLNRGQNLFLYPEGAWNLTPNLLIQPLFFGFVQMVARTDADIIPVVIERFGKRYAVIIGRRIDFKRMTHGESCLPYMQDVFGTQGRDGNGDARALRRVCGNTFAMSGQECQSEQEGQTRCEGNDRTPDPEQEGQTHCVKNDRTLDPEMDRDRMVRYLRDAMATLKWMILEREPVCERKTIPDGYEEAYVEDIMSESEPYYTAKIIRYIRYRDRKHPSPDEVFLPLRALSKWRDLPASG
ncbi:MAG: hypothetical protein IK016_05815 [Lachnospiraceae bacterium]|nr:hypothetical protein [Lachnospiraceae bacterium]